MTATTIQKPNNTIGRFWNKFRMPPIFITALFYVLLLLCLFATLQKECGSISQKRGKRSATRRVPSSRKVFIRDLSLPWLSSPRNLVGDLSFRKRTTTTNNGFPTTTFGNDDFTKKEVILNLFQDLLFGVFVVVVWQLFIKGLFRFFFLLKFW